MEADSQLRVGLAGLGRFGMLHARILASLPNVRVVAACDPAKASRVAASDVLPETEMLADVDQLLQRDDLDAVMLITPEPLHETQAAAAITRGLPTFVEKPLATSAAAARRVADQARSAGVYLQAGFVLRFESQHSWLAERVHAGELGQLVLLRAKRNCSRAWFSAYGDRAHSVHETVIHDIDLMLWLSRSRCESVYAVSRFLRGYRFPDATFATLRFADGTVGTLETSWLVPDAAPNNVLTPGWSGTIDAELEVIGSEATGQLRLLDSGLKLWSSGPPRHVETALWPEQFRTIGGALRTEVEHFLERVRTSTPSTVASVPDAVAGLEIAEAIIQSAATGHVVHLEASE